MMSAEIMNLNLLFYFIHINMLLTSVNILPNISVAMMAPIGLALKINPTISNDIPLSIANGGKNGDIIERDKQQII